MRETVLIKELYVNILQPGKHNNYNAAASKIHSGKFRNAREQIRKEGENVKNK